LGTGFGVEAADAGADFFEGSRGGGEDVAAGAND
jgi:hypothetical protein